MTYSIRRTDKAQDQLRNIIFRIVENSGDVKVAINFLNKFEELINNLKLFPNLGVRPRYSILNKQGYRVLHIEKYLIFYKVNLDNKIITIYAIVDSRRDYLNLI